MFESKRLRLIAMDEDQEKEIFKFYNDYDIIAGITYTGAAIYPWTFSQFQEDNKQPGIKFAVQLKETDEIMGHASVTNEAFTKVYYPLTYIKKEFRGQGYGSELSQLVTDITFKEFNAHKIRTTIFEFNTPSFKRYERQGWTLEGRLRQECFRNGQYWDVLKYGLLRSEWELLRLGQEDGVK